MTTYTILGAVEGSLWWPVGEPAQKPISYSFKRSETPPPFVNSAETLREAVEQLMTAEGGDFSDAPRLTADTFLLVRHDSPSGRRTVSRWFDLTRFPSISDYVGGGS